MINLQKIAEELVQYAKKQGADQVQINAGRNSNFNVQVREGEIEELKEAGSTGISLKIIKDEKVADAYSSDLSEDTLRKLVDNAVKRAQYTSKDPNSKLPELEKLTVSPESLKLYDESVEAEPPENKIAVSKQLEKILLSDKRVKVSLGSGYGTSYGEKVVVNSNGFSNSYKYSSASCYVYGQAGEDQNNMFEDGWSDTARAIGKLDPPEKIAKTAIERVVRLIGAKKIKSQNVPIVFDNTMASSLLRFLASCLYGSSIYTKRSFLAGKIGEKIAGDNITVIDDGTLPARPGSRPFDSEGVPTRKNSIIENGVLKNYLLDSYSANKLNMKSTGNASGTTNFYIQPGSTPQEDIIKSVEKGLFLTKTIGQGTVPTSGDISKGAFGLWIENGRLTYPVAEITFSGNLGDALKNIETIGDDLDPRRSITSPTLLVNGLSISGL